MRKPPSLVALSVQTRSIEDGEATVAVSADGASGRTVVAETGPIVAELPATFIAVMRYVNASSAARPRSWYVVASAGASARKEKLLHPAPTQRSMRYTVSLLALSTQLRSMRSAEIVVARRPVGSAGMNVFVV